MVYPPAVASMANAGPHGFTEVLYAYTSQTGNNGSAFAGLTGNTLFYNLTGAVAMFIGRFWMIIPAMAIAGSLAEKKSVPASFGTFPTTGGLFVGLVGRRHPDRRRPHILPRARARTHRRASRDASRHGFLNGIHSELRLWKPRNCASGCLLPRCFDPKIVIPAIGQAFVKLNPRTLCSRIR